MATFGQTISRTRLFDLGTSLTRLSLTELSLTGLLLAAPLSACGGDEGQRETVPPSVLDPDRYKKEEKATRIEYKLADPARTPIYPPPADAYTTDSGLKFVVFKRGTNTSHPLSTTNVTVHYEGYTTDKNVFDSSVKRGEPASFTLNQVIAGWREGVKLMTEGDHFRFWIPEKDAYRGEPGKPKGLLIFDVQLLAIEK